MTQLRIDARPRTVLGKKVKSLRKHGLLPANVYGHGLQSQPLELNAHDFSKLQRHLSPTSIIDLVVDGGRTRPVMIHRTQRSVRNGLPTHLEFFEVNPKERLTASVPLTLVGESEAVRRNEAMVLQEMSALEVTCLPADLPTSIEVHLDHLVAVGDAVHIRDLIYDRDKIEIKANPDDRVIALTVPQMRVEEEEAPAAETAAGATAEGAEESES